MNLNEEQLKEVESLAGLFFHPADIMTAIGLPAHEAENFMEIIWLHNAHPLYIAYHKGRMTASIELRHAIKQAALNGSNPAQNTMIEYFNKSQL